MVFIEDKREISSATFRININDSLFKTEQGIIKINAHYEPETN